MYFLFSMIFLFLAYFIVRTQYVIHKAYELCANQLFMLSMRLPVNSRLFVIKALGSQKLHVDFLIHGELASLTSTLFKVRICFDF